VKINLDLSSNEVDIFLDIIDLLSNNKETILSDIKPNVQSFLDRGSLFEGGFKVKFIQEFEKFVISELKSVAMNHFHLDAETASIIMDRDMLKLVGVLDYYLDKENYK
jgi:hypothetical protein